jgi:periplasmic protein TonB
MKSLYLILLLTAIAATAHAQKVDTGYDKTFTKIEIEPSYPGGDSAWKKYLGKNLHYPDDAISNGVSGTVWVQFIVNTDSTIHDIQAISGPTTGGLRNEAVRVIKQSGKWVPGIQNGYWERAYVKRPIQFVLEHN